MRHRTYTEDRLSTQNDSFLRHWCVYSNDGLDVVCVLTVKAFWCKVSCRVSRCSEFGKKKKKKSHVCFLLPEGVMVNKTSHLER